MPARGPRHRTNRQRAAGMVRSHQAMQLYLQKLSFREVGEQMGVSTQRAHTLVKRAMEAVAADTESMARLWLARQLELHYMAMQRAWDIVDKPCPMCGGAGAIEDDNVERARVWVGMNPDGTPAYDDEGEPIRPELGTPIVGNACPRCEGEGFQHPATVRLQAMDRHERACGHVAKLLGLYQPDRHLHVHADVGGGWREELASYSDEDIDIMLLEYARRATRDIEATGYVRQALPQPGRQEG